MYVHKIVHWDEYKQLASCIRRNKEGEEEEGCSSLYLDYLDCNLPESSKHTVYPYLVIAEARLMKHKVSV